MHVHGVISAQGFIDYWNNYVGYNKGKIVKIDEVIVIAHGSIAGDKGSKSTGYMYFGSDINDDKTTNLYARPYEGSDVSVEKLTAKEMDYFMFSTCNSGNPDTYNLAFAFMKKNKIKNYLISWDGGTIFDFDAKVLRAGGPNSGQATWEKHVNRDSNGNPTRERIGWRGLYDYI